MTIPLVVAAGADDMAALPQTLWLQAVVPLLFACWLATSRVRLPLVRRFAPILAFLAWAALSLFWATDRFASERALFPWLAAAGLALLIANTTQSEADVRRLLMALFGASVVVSALGLLQHIGGWDGIPQAVPPAGTMGNKNIAAGFVAVMAPVGAVAFFAARTAWIASLLALSLGMALAFVAQTGCRAAGLALAAQIAVALSLVAARVVKPRSVGVNWGPLCAGAGAFLWLATMQPAIPGTAQGTPAELLDGTARPLFRFLSGAAPAPGADSAAELSPTERAERSVAIRLGVWGNTLQLIRESPLAGVGVGNFRVHYPRFARSAGVDGTRIDERVDSVHNDYAQIAAELGLVGAGLLLWVLLSIGRSILAAIRDPASAAHGLQVASALGLLGLLLLAAVSPMMGQPIALVAAATFLGVTMRLPFARPAPTVEPGSKPWAAYALDLPVLAAAATFVIAGVWGSAQLDADRHVLNMAIAEARGDWPEAIREGLIARRLNPGRTDARFGTASAMLRVGQTNEAARMLEELVAVDPYNANALGNLGMAYAASGDLERSASCYERVLRLRPDDRIARAQLKRVMASEGAGNAPS